MKPCDRSPEWCDSCTQQCCVWVHLLMTATNFWQLKRMLVVVVARCLVSLDLCNMFHHVGHPQIDQMWLYLFG